jgi:hypothetical protein
MRVGLLVLFVPRLVLADPPATKPAEPVVIAPRVDPHDMSRVPNVTGQAAGIVIAPPADFKDARDYPLGMVIRPPDIHDDAFVISSGTIAESVRGFGRRLQDAIGELGKLFERH